MNHGLMLITPRFGADRATLLQQLVEVETSLMNVRGRAITAVDLFNEYLRWANEAVRLLRHQVRAALDVLHHPPERRRQPVGPPEALVYLGVPVWSRTNQTLPTFWPVTSPGLASLAQ